jgi:hypothetical protein
MKRTQIAAIIHGLKKVKFSKSKGYEQSYSQEVA